MMAKMPLHTIILMVLLFYIYKKTYDKIVSKVKKAGIKTATFKRKK